MSQPDALVELVPVEWGKLVPDVARKVAEFYVQPANLAGLAGSALLPLVVFRHKPPPLPYLIVSLAGWAIGRMAYQASRDLHYLAEQTREYSQPDPG